MRKIASFDEKWEEEEEEEEWVFISGFLLEWRG